VLTNNPRTNDIPLIVLVVAIGFHSSFVDLCLPPFFSRQQLAPKARNMGGGHDMYGGGVKGFVSNLVHGGQGHGHGYPRPCAGAYPPAHGYPSHGYAPAAYPAHGAPHGKHTSTHPYT
jgi:hypothetical protein